MWIMTTMYNVVFLLVLHEVYITTQMLLYLCNIGELFNELLFYELHSTEITMYLQMQFIKGYKLK